MPAAAPFFDADAAGPACACAPFIKLGDLIGGFGGEW